MKPCHVDAALDAVILQNLAIANDNGRADGRICLFLEGHPGGGKSSLVKQAAARHGLGLVDLRLVQLDPVDLRGIPTVVNGRTVWASPDELPSDPAWRGILFLDELPQAVPLVQNTISQLVLDRCIGKYRLPEGAIIVAAGNPRSSKAATNEIPRHLANRFVFLTLESDVGDFLRWGARNGVRPEVTSFFQQHDQLLHAFDASQKCNPSPRSWAYVSSILDLDLAPAIRQTLIAGAVGEGPAHVFEGHLRLWAQIPDWREVIANPKQATIPAGENAPGLIYALATKLAREITKANAEGVLTYLRRLPAEYAVVCMKEATARDEALIKALPVRRWFAENMALMVA